MGYLLDGQQWRRMVQAHVNWIKAQGGAGLQKLTERMHEVGEAAQRRAHSDSRRWAVETQTRNNDYRQWYVRVKRGPCGAEMSGVDVKPELLD